MAKITTLPQMIEYIKTVLGYPVVNIEVSDSQFTQVIEDSIQDFQRYSYGDGSYEEYMPYPLLSGVSVYDLSALPQEISDVVDIRLSVGLGQINELFTAQHTLLYNDWINGNYPGGGAGTGGAYPGNIGGAMVMGNFYTTMTYLKEISNTFERTYVANFNPNSLVMNIYPTPEQDCIALLRVYKKEDAVNLYNHPLVKKLCTARSMIIWGQNLDKYAMTLPGGGTINGAAIIQRGEAMEEKTLENIKLETEPPIFLVG